MTENPMSSLLRVADRSCSNDMRSRRLVIATILLAFCASLEPLLLAQPAVPVQANVPCNLVSWWPLDGNASDIRSNNNGTITGSGTYPAAMVAAGWKSGGHGSLIVVPNSPTLDVSRFTRGFSFDLWLRIDHINEWNMAILWKGLKGISVTSPFSIAIQGTNKAADPAGTVYFSVADGTRSQFVKSQTPLQVGTFYHITATADNANLILYINGVQTAKAPKTVKPYNSSYPLQIGGSSTSPGNFFNGVIDEIELFDRALDATPRSEIAAIYEAGSSGKCGKSRP